MDDFKIVRIFAFEDMKRQPNRQFTDDFLIRFRKVSFEGHSLFEAHALKFQGHSLFEAALPVALRSQLKFEIFFCLGD